MSTLKKEIVIRVAALDDAEELLEIYAPYVRETAITFEYEVFFLFPYVYNSDLHIWRFQPPRHKLRAP